LCFKFLPYASGALTLVTVALAKWAELKHARQQWRSMILTYIKAQLTNALSAVKSKILKSVNTQDFLGNLANTVVHKAVDVASGIDPRELELIAKGDQAAITEFARRINVEPVIAMMVVALIRRDHDAVVEASKLLATHFDFDGELLAALVSMATNTSLENRTHAFKAFMNQLSRQLRNSKPVILNQSTHLRLFISPSTCCRASK
jgi:hypothetical protein